MMQYNTIQHSTIQYNTVQCNTILYHKVQHKAIQYYTIQYNTIQHNTIQYRTIQNNRIQYNTISCVTHRTLHITVRTLFESNRTYVIDKETSILVSSSLSLPFHIFVYRCFSQSIYLSLSLSLSLLLSPSIYLFNIFLSL